MSKLLESSLTLNGRCRFLYSPNAPRQGSTPPSRFPYQLWPLWAWVQEALEDAEKQVDARLTKLCKKQCEDSVRSGQEMLRILYSTRCVPSGYGRKFRRPPEHGGLFPVRQGSKSFCVHAQTPKKLVFEVLLPYESMDLSGVSEHGNLNLLTSYVSPLKLSST